jgi:tetratricopeptide (TPR) repeat protein
MKYRNILTILITPAILIFVPFVSMQAQSYQEMDGELIAAEKKFWDTNLNPAYEKTLKEYNAGNYAKAAEEANKFLAYASTTIGNLPVLRARARINLVPNGMNFQNARADLIRAIQHNPQDVWNQLYLGELYLKVQRGFEADRHFTKALAIDPNSYWALNGKSRAAFFARDFQGCVAAVTKLTAHAEYKKENDAWAYFRLGECYASLGDKANAKQNFERAVAVQPGLKDSWFYLAFLKEGYSCKKLGRKSPDKPFEKFTAILRSSFCPDSLPVLFDVDLEKDAGLRDFVLFYRAEFNRRINKSESSDTLGYEDAKMFLKEARWLDDQAKRSGKPMDEKTFNEILELLNHAINIKSRNDDVLTEDADAAARVMRAKLLLSHSDKQIQLLAWREQLELSNLPRSDYQTEKKEGGIIPKPLFKNGADVNSALLRGLVYSTVKQNHRAALAEFNAAIKTLETVYVKPRFNTDAPVFAEPYRRKGDMLERLGNVTDSAEAYVQALEINPSNAEAKDGLKRLEQNQLNIGKTAIAAALGQLELRSRVNEISERVSEAERSFNFTTNSLQIKPAGASKAREVCNAVNVFVRALSAERIKLSSLGSSIDRSSKLWQYYKTNLDNLDLKIKKINEQSANCSKVN